MYAQTDCTYSVEYYNADWVVIAQHRNKQTLVFLPLFQSFKCCTVHQMNKSNRNRLEEIDRPDDSC